MKLSHRFLLVLALLIVIAPAGAMKKPEAGIQWGIFERQGVRPTMEDAYAEGILNLTPHATAHYFAMFDGHNGAQAADYAAAHAIQYFKNAYDGEASTDTETKIQAALKASYLKLDKEMQEKFEHSGTTALSAIILGNEVYLAWAGDTRAVVAGAYGKIKAQTTDHKPDSEEEKKRITQTGEIITTQKFARGSISRVGGLAVSRALGDADAKKEVKVNAIIAEPQIIKTTVQRGDVILIACDGLWDVIENKQAVTFMLDQMGRGLLQRATKNPFAQTGFIPEKEKVVENGNNKEFILVAKALTKQAYDKNSGDNISVLIIQIQ